MPRPNVLALRSSSLMGHDPLGALSDDTLLALAWLLRYVPPPSHVSTAILAQEFMEAQKTMIESSAFPRELCARRGQVLRNLVQYPFANRFPPLCPVHKRLDVELIGQVYRLLRVEVSVRTDTARAFIVEHEELEVNGGVRTDSGDHAHDGNDDDEEMMQPTTLFALKVMVEEISSLVGLYLDPEQVEQYFGRFATADRFDAVENGCPACILAVVGGQGDVLVALRANMIARYKSGSSEPKLLRVVEAWIDASGGPEKRELMREESDLLVKELKRMRKAIKKVRRERREQRRRQKEMEKEEEEDKAADQRGRSEHREGMSMPQVSEGQRASFPVGGNANPAPRGFSPPDPWDLRSPSPVSEGSHCSADVSPEEDEDDADVDVDENGQYIPPRANWARPRPATTTQQTYGVPPPGRSVSSSVYSQSNVPSTRTRRPASSVIPGLPRPSDYASITQANAAAMAAPSTVYTDRRDGRGRQQRQSMAAASAVASEWTDVSVHTVTPGDREREPRANRNRRQSVNTLDTVREEPRDDRHQREPVPRVDRSSRQLQRLDEQSEDADAATSTNLTRWEDFYRPEDRTPPRQHRSSRENHRNRQSRGQDQNPQNREHHHRQSRNPGRNQTQNRAESVAESAVTTWEEICRKWVNGEGPYRDRST